MPARESFIRDASLACLDEIFESAKGKTSMCWFSIIKKYMWAIAIDESKRRDSAKRKARG